MSDLQTIAQEISVCRLCPLANSRLYAVPGDGPRSARLMFIGEAPGKNEDLQGEPFVGHAGKVLDRALLGLSPLKAVRGRLIVKERRYFATYHPAAAGRSRSWNNLFEADIRKLGAFLTNSQAGKCT